MGDTVTQKGPLLRSPLSLVHCNKSTLNYYVYYCAARFPCIKLYELFLHDYIFTHSAVISSCFYLVHIMFLLIEGALQNKQKEVLCKNIYVYSSLDVFSDRELN